MRKLFNYALYVCIAASIFSCRAQPERKEAAYGIEKEAKRAELAEDTLKATGEILKKGLEETEKAGEVIGSMVAETVKKDTGEEFTTSPAYVFTPEDFPEYTGNAADTVNNGIPYFTKQDLSREAFENYSSLDALGRCGTAYANICIELMPETEREEIGMVKPSGWKTAKYPGMVEGNILYNRCHLIAYQLAGENANNKNLITGTRYLNVIGMLPYENMVADYIRNNPGNHVLYRVTPLYTGDCLVADGVLMEAYSVEDMGAGICFNVYCHNVQPGIAIDYRDGSSSPDPDFTGEYVTESSFTE